MTGDDDEDWLALVVALGGLGVVTRTSRGLDVDLGHRVVQIVMTPRDWDDMPVVHGGYPVEETLDQVRHQPRDMPFLVYDGQYALRPSASPEIPPDPVWQRLDALRGPDGSIPGAGWFAERRDGTRARYAEFEDDPEV